MSATPSHEQALARNLAAIHEQLLSREPSFAPREDLDRLAQGSASEARTALLAAKRAGAATPLTHLVYQCHHRMGTEQNRHRAITELTMKTAVPQAVELDARATDDAPDLPLYGFVMGLKECFKAKGTKSTCGMLLSETVWDASDPFVEWLERHGATFVVKTNVPQLLFAMESNNNIYGNCAHPRDPRRTAGGSSGGDGCLVALRHIHASIGSDVAGSGRIPAAFCGAHSIIFSPSRIDRSSHAIPFETAPFFASLGEPQYGIRPTFAVTARSVADLEAVAGVVLNYHTQKPRLVQLPYRPVAECPRRVGVLREFDSLMELTAANRRAMETARQALQSQGVEVVELDIRDHAEQLITWTAAMYGKSRVLTGVLSGKLDLREPLIPVFQQMAKSRKLPLWVVRLMGRFWPDVKARCFLRAMVLEQTYNTEFIMGKVFEVRAALVAQMRAAGVEVLLAPSMPPAPFIHDSTALFPWVAYLNMFNAFGWTAGHFSVTRVEPQEQTYQSRFNGQMEANVRRLMEGAAGLPVGVQVAAPEWRDELVLAVMRTLENRIKFE